MSNVKALREHGIPVLEADDGRDDDDQALEEARQGLAWAAIPKLSDDEHRDLRESTAGAASRRLSGVVGHFVGPA